MGKDYEQVDRATLERKAAERDELAQIATRTDWTPLQRLTAQHLVLNAKTPPGFQYRVIEACSARLVAEWVGASDRTAREAMQALAAAGVISRDIHASTVNKFGAEIPRSKMDIRRGDRFQVETTISLPLELPPLPEMLSDGKNVKRSRTVNAKRTAEFRNLKEQLQKLLDPAACPHCGEVGHLHVHIGATCTSCGTVLDEGEVEILAGTEIISEPICPSNFAPEPPPQNTRRALSELKGKASTPTPSIDYKNFDEGTLTIELPAKTEIVSVQSLEAEIISVSDEAQRGGGAAEPREILTGVDTLDYLDGLGAAFCLVRNKIGIKPCDDHGTPLAGNYLDLPQPLSVAAAELRRGGVVGLLPEHSQGLTLLDVDFGKDSLEAMWPAFTKVSRITRPDAPGRVKYLMIVVDNEGKLQRQDAKNPTRKAELLGRGHGNVAGLHPSGAPYELMTGELMVFTRSEIEEMLAQWIPNPYTAGVTSNKSPTPPLRASQTNARYGQTLVEAAIAVWNIAHKGEVEREVASCRQKKGYYSTRSDDRTPSTAKVSDDAWRDYGQMPDGPNGEPLPVMDPLEMHLRLNPDLNKRDFIWSVVVPEYRRSKGSQ